MPIQLSQGLDIQSTDAVDKRNIPATLGAIPPAQMHNGLYSFVAGIAYVYAGQNGTNISSQWKRLAYHEDYTSLLARVAALENTVVVEANFSFSTSSLVASFNSTSIFPQGATPTYLWDFGDGTTSSSANPSHTYQSSGTRQVSLTVTAAGESSIRVRNVSVQQAVQLETFHFGSLNKVPAVPADVAGLTNSNEQNPNNYNFTIQGVSGNRDVFAIDKSKTLSDLRQVGAPNNELSGSAIGIVVIGEYRVYYTNQLGAGTRNWVASA